MNAKDRPNTAWQKCSHMDLTISAHNLQEFEGHVLSIDCYSGAFEWCRIDDEWAPAVVCNPFFEGQDPFAISSITTDGEFGIFVLTTMDVTGDRDTDWQAYLDLIAPYLRANRDA